MNSRTHTLISIFVASFLLFVFLPACTPLGSCWDDSDCASGVCLGEGVCEGSALTTPGDEKIPPGQQKKNTNLGKGKGSPTSKDKSGDSSDD